MKIEQKRLISIFLLTGIFVTVLIAFWLPVTAVQYFRLRIVAYDWLTAAEVSSPQRVTAAIGGLIATLTLAKLVWFPTTFSLPAVRGATLFVLGSVCFALVLFNFSARSLTDLISEYSPQMMMLLLLLVIGGIVLLGVIVTYNHFKRNQCINIANRVIVDAIGAGSAYGCFSALWHCCPPIWEGRQYEVTGSIFALSCILTVITALSLRWNPPVGEIIGGVLLAMIYPLHSVLWCIQMIFAGAFFIWIARQTGSVFTPAIAASIALIVHMTLPFLGWAGVAISIILLILFMLCSLKEISLIYMAEQPLAQRIIKDGRPW